MCLLGFLALGAGCEEEASRPTLGVYTPPTQDPNFTPEPDPTPFVPPLEDVCAEGQVRCVATDGPEVLRCARKEAAGSGRAALRWEAGRCAQGEVCRQGACAPLRCTPGETVCASASELGVCAASGEEVEGGEPCPAGSACKGGACVDLCDSASRARSYLGCEYMVGFLPNVSRTVGEMAHGGPGGASDGPFALVVANPDPRLTAEISVEGAEGEAAWVLGEVEVKVNIDFPGAGAPVEVRSSLRGAGGAEEGVSGHARGLKIPPKGVATLLLDVPMLARVSALERQGWRLRSSLPVAAYQFNPYCCNYTFTNDASILLPTSALGSRYRFAGAPAWEGLPAGLVALAAQPDTRVSVKLPEGARLLNAVVPVQVDAQGVVEVTLQAGEVLSLQDAQGDLTGAVVEADKPLAVFSSHQCTFIPHGSEACDHLEEQLIPEDTWGQTYVLSRPVRRSNARSEVTYWRLLAGEAGARVRIPSNLYRLGLKAPFAQGLGSCLYRMAEGVDAEGEQTVLELGPGEDCTMGLWSSSVLYSDGPLLVMGFVSGQDAGSIVAEGVSIGSRGDPSMFLLAPVEQYRSEYTFLTPETYERDYVTISALRGAGGALTLDGAPLDPAAQGVVVEEIQGSDHLLLHVPLEDGAHTLEGTAPFGILVYAYDDYVSYAYTGGLNLLKR